MFKTRTGRQVLISFAFIILIVILGSLFQLNRLRALNNLVVQLYEHPYVVNDAVLSSQTAMIRMHRDMKDVALAETPEEIDAAVKDVDDHEQIVLDRLEEAKAQFLGDKQDFDSLIAEFRAWRPIRNEVISLTRKGKRAEAAAITKSQGADYVASLEKNAGALDEFADGKAAEFVSNAQAAGSQALLLIVGLVVITVGIIIVIAIYTTRSITRTAEQIQDATTILASSSNQILSATSQVAAGAAETATAVSQTSTTVEEVKQAADVASQKASRVSESAQQAVQVSQMGQTAVSETIERMTGIREQMGTVAESIVSLSEQSQAIGAIIVTVNDLADQSNLLAVNAAIEAATAGEQGKRFAVVAEEIKSLAEQSKQATASVRGILGDIQKAVSAAVMATEQGSNAVEAGVQQSAEAGDAIRTLARSLEESAQAAILIATSARQQLVGTDQVVLAMESIGEASAQTAAGTSQTEEAARQVHELGRKLQQLMEEY